MAREFHETLEEFKDNRSYVWNRPQGGLCVPADQKDKVSQEVYDEGKLTPYLGDTVIFDLDADTCKEIGRMQDMLYERLGSVGLLAQRLPQDSFHITLHDLFSGPLAMKDEVLSGMEAREKRVQEILGGFDFEPISMRATTLFSMVSKSIVLCFEPAQERDCALLTALYNSLQEVCELGHPLTPHVTLAYYRPYRQQEQDGEQAYTWYGADVSQALKNAFEEIRFEGGEVLLEKKNLRYCCFSDMSRYVSREAMLRQVQIDSYIDFFEKNWRLYRGWAASGCLYTGAVDTPVYRMAERTLRAYALSLREPQAKKAAAADYAAAVFARCGKAGDDCAALDDALDVLIACNALKAFSEKRDTLAREGSCEICTLSAGYDAALARLTEREGRLSCGEMRMDELAAPVFTREHRALRETIRRLERQGKEGSASLAMDAAYKAFLSCGAALENGGNPEMTEREAADTIDGALALLIETGALDAFASRMNTLEGMVKDEEEAQFYAGHELALMRLMIRRGGSV